jgi:hypothetical protein
MNEHEPVTAIFFSCMRISLLKKTIMSFLLSNSYPIAEMIIVNDSGSCVLSALLQKWYPRYTIVCHPYNVGLIESIDLGYSHIKTEYFFHSEDDWCCTGKDGFIQRSLDVLKARPDVEEVWLSDMNAHPIEPTIYKAGETSYQLVAQNFQGDWHGFSTACGLKRMSDYKKVAPYKDIPWEKTIWHREQAIGLEYYKLGYRSAILMDEYVTNIGVGKSEYVTGLEK